MAAGCAIYCAQPRVAFPKAERGVLDLSNYDMASAGPCALDGTWEFYYRRFIAPGGFAAAVPDLYIPVPDSWNHHGFAAAGLATYRLRVRLGEKRSPDELLSLRLDTVGTAYKLFVNGRIAAVVGKPTETAAHSVGSYKVLTIPIRAVGSELELVFHVSNYWHRSGGLWFSHRLGTPQQITRLREKGLLSDFFFLGALFIIGFYHVSLYFNRRREVDVLHFGLFCIMIAIRVPFTGEFFLTQLWPDFPLDVQLRLEYATIYLTPVFFISFLALNYAQKTRRFVLYCVSIVSGLFLTTVFLLPPLVFTGLVVWYYCFLAACVFWGLGVVLAAVARREPNALASLPPFLVLGATLVNDILFSLEYVYTASLLPYGLMFFVFVQAVLLSRKFYHAFQLAENLSASLLTTNRDLTDLKDSLEQKVADRTEVLSEKNQQLAEAISTREKFLSILAHDLRSPMVGMARVLDAARDGTVALEEKLLRTLAKTTHESVDLLENMLNWALSRKHELTAYPDDIDLGRLFGKIADLYAHTLAEKNIRLTASLGDSPWVHADPGMLEMVLRNLLANAVKFTPAGGQITVTAQRRAGSLRVEIADTGPGISSETLGNLFAPQAFKTTRRGAHPGSGLGLVICKEFVEANGGTIGAYNLTGKGCCLWFELPPGEASREETIRPEVFSGLKALIVEDNALHRRLIEEVVVGLGISVDLASDGAAAWEILQRQNFDFVVLDVQLPGLDGFALADKIAKRQTRPRVIFHSSYPAAQIRSGATPGCVDAILAKPLERDALAATLRRFYG